MARSTKPMLHPQSRDQVSLCRHSRSDLARDTGATKPAVAARILGKVLLMVILGEIEFRRIENFRRDRAISLFLECGLVIFLRGLRGSALSRIINIDTGSILGAGVVALPHSLRGIVAFPERLEQFAVRHLSGVVNDKHGFVVPGPS